MTGVETTPIPWRVRGLEPVLIQITFQIFPFP